MKKIVTTEMSEKSVWITIGVLDSEGKQVSFIQHEYPVDLVNPQTSLRIATLLVSDPTLPKDEKVEGK